MVSFVNLPPEIINYILYDLAPPDLLSCQLANKYLHSTIRDSVLLQHKLALTRACAEDSPLSHLLTTEKLAAIKRIEDAWINMHSDFSTRMPVPLRQSGVYDLTGGLYLLSNADRTSVGLLRLPTKEGDKPEWTMHLVGKLLVDVGLCVYEHDLMVIVTSTVRPGAAGAPNTFAISLEFIEISTRKPHPIAQQNPLFVMTSAWEKPSVGIEIVGKHLVLVLSFSARGHPQDRIYIFDWKTGVTVAGFEARSHTYAALVFLDEEHILLPNTRANSLDVYRIPPAPTLALLKPILVLQLPPLNEGRILGFAPCRAEPNPIAKSSYPSMAARQRPADAGDDFLDLTPDRGFLLKAETALCMFHLRVHVLELNIMPDGGLQMGFPFRYSFTFVTQRQSLLDLVRKHASDVSENIPGPETSSIPVTTSSNGQSTTATTPPTTTSGAPAVLPNQAVLPYDQWGPDITAWFGSNENDVSPMWITTSAGRRCIRMAMSSADNTEGERFFVCEFGGEPPKTLSPVGGCPRDKKDNGDERLDHDDKIDKGKGKAEGGGDDDSHGDEPKPGRRQKITSTLLSMMAPFLADVVDPPAAGPSGHAEHVAGSTTSHEASGSHSHDDDDDNDSDADGDIWPGGDAASAYVQWSAEDFVAAGDDHGGDDDDIFMDAEDHDVGDVDLHAHLHDEDLENDDEGHAFNPTMTFFYPSGPEDGGGEQSESAGGENENDDTNANEPNQDQEDHGLGYDIDEIDIHGNDGEDDEYSEGWTHDPLPDSGEATLFVAGGRELVCPDVFREPVRHNLPYIVRGSKERYRWDGILLDEERVIGIKATDMGHVDDIEILHFG